LRRLNSISLFSGCGGLDLGLERAGFRTLIALDNDASACESHALNFPHVALIRKPVAAVTKGELRHLIGKKRIALLAGGPPCPPFSKSRFYRKDKPRALADANGLETITGYLDVLGWVRPKAFLLENVAGLAYSVHGAALRLIVERAESLGYSVDWRIINAADYGVPQIRERFFMVGTLAGRFEWPAPGHAKDPHADLFSQGRLPWATAGAAIGDLDTEEAADDEGHYAGGKHHDLLELVPPGDNYLYFTEKRGYPTPLFDWRSRYWSFLLKLSPDMPSWTIQARRSNNMGPFHWRNRILRVEEVKRLQTFPDDFALAGNVERQWRQIGNAVPPVLAEKLGAAIRTCLEGDQGGTRDC